MIIAIPAVARFNKLKPSSFLILSITFYLGLHSPRSLNQLDGCLTLRSTASCGTRK